MISDILVALQKYLACMLQGATNKPITVTLAPVSRDKEASQGSLVITLLRVEEETSRKPQNLYAVKDSVLHPKSPDVDINLEVLISAPAEPYETALRLISNVIRAVNSIKTVHQPEGLTDADFKYVQSFNISLMGLSLDQTLSLWQTLGGTLVPSVVYKVRMLTMEGVLDAAELHFVEHVQVETKLTNPFNPLPKPNKEEKTETTKKARRTKKKKANSKT